MSLLYQHTVRVTVLAHAQFVGNFHQSLRKKSRSAGRKEGRKEREKTEPRHPHGASYVNEKICIYYYDIAKSNHVKRTIVKTYRVIR